MGSSRSVMIKVNKPSSKKGSKRFAARLWDRLFGGSPSDRKPDMQRGEIQISLEARRVYSISIVQCFRLLGVAVGAGRVTPERYMGQVIRTVYLAPWGV